MQPGTYIARLRVTDAGPSRRRARRSPSRRTTHRRRRLSERLRPGRPGSWATSSPLGVGDGRAAGDASRFGPVVGARPAALPRGLPHASSADAVARRERDRRRRLDRRGDAAARPADGRAQLPELALGPPADDRQLELPRAFNEDGDRGLEQHDQRTDSADARRDELHLVSWSDEGAQTHNVIAGATATYTAAYQVVTPPKARTWL